MESEKDTLTGVFFVQIFYVYFADIVGLPEVVA